MSARHYSFQPLHFVAAAILLTLVFWSGRAGLAQDKEDVNEGKHRRDNIQVKAQEQIREELRRAHPDWSEAQIDEEIKKVQDRFQSGAEAPAGASVRSVLPPRSHAYVVVGERANELLQPKAASGWGYVGYAPRGGFESGVEEVRVNRNGGIKKFLLVDHSEYLGKNESDFAHLQTIEIPHGERLSGENLSHFYEVNNRFLRDVPISTHSLRERAERSDLANSNALIVTGARLANGREVLTIYSLADLAKTGFPHGEVYTDLHTEAAFVPVLTGKESKAKMTKESGLEPVLRKELSGFEPGRVYYYGDTLETVNLDALCRFHGKEMVLRSPEVENDILETEARLQAIENRALSTEKLTIVDGLPQDREAVQSMGFMVGDPADWLDFHDKVNRLFRVRQVQTVTTKEDFVRTLREDDSDVIVLVAHSTGTQLYLNGKKTSLKELEALPPRPQRSERPRVAFLVSCDAGKPQEGSRSWLSQLFDQDLPPLAQILIEKKFVDKVIAPDHKIRAEESLTVLQRALEGARTHSVFDGWRTWGRDWRLLENRG
jgi:hypothetical protein